MGFKIPGLYRREGSIPSRTNSTVEDPMSEVSYQEVSYQMDYLEGLDKLLRETSEPVLLMCVTWHSHFGEPGYGSVFFVEGEINKAQKAYDALVNDGFVKSPEEEVSDEQC